ncbi:hypothetical protein [Acetivibrio cellulolyticus]|nr:hypothetical protein [Acetivibrio cellulolyticus]
MSQYLEDLYNGWEIIAKYDKITKENNQYCTETSVKMRSSFKYK